MVTFVVSLSQLFNDLGIFEAFHHPKVAAGELVFHFLKNPDQRSYKRLAHRVFRHLDIEKHHRWQVVFVVDVPEKDPVGESFSGWIRLLKEQFLSHSLFSQHPPARSFLLCLETELNNETFNPSSFPVRFRNLQLEVHGFAHSDHEEVEQKFREVDRAFKEMITRIHKVCDPLNMPEAEVAWRQKLKKYVPEVIERSRELINLVWTQESLSRFGLSSESEGPSEPWTETISKELKTEIAKSRKPFDGLEDFSPSGFLKGQLRQHAALNYQKFAFNFQFLRLPFFGRNHQDDLLGLSILIGLLADQEFAGTLPSSHNHFVQLEPNMEVIEAALDTWLASLKQEQDRLKALNLKLDPIESREYIPEKPFAEILSDLPQPGRPKTPQPPTVTDSKDNQLSDWQNWRDEVQKELDDYASDIRLYIASLTSALRFDMEEQLKSFEEVHDLQQAITKAENRARELQNKIKKLKTQIGPKSSWEQDTAVYEERIETAQEELPSRRQKRIYWWSVMGVSLLVAITGLITALEEDPGHLIALLPTSLLLLLLGAIAWWAMRNSNAKTRKSIKAIYSELKGISKKAFEQLEESKKKQLSITELRIQLSALKHTLKAYHEQLGRYQEKEAMLKYHKEQINRTIRLIEKYRGHSRDESLSPLDSYPIVDYLKPKWANPLYGLPAVLQTGTADGKIVFLDNPVEQGPEWIRKVVRSAEFQEDKVYPNETL